MLLKRRRHEVLYANARAFAPLDAAQTPYPRRVVRNSVFRFPPGRVAVWRGRHARSRSPGTWSRFVQPLGSLTPPSRQLHRRRREATKRQRRLNTNIGRARLAYRHWSSYRRRHTRRARRSDSHWRPADAAAPSAALARRTPAHIRNTTLVKRMIDSLCGPDCLTTTLDPTEALAGSRQATRPQPRARNARPPGGPRSAQKSRHRTAPVGARPLPRRPPRRLPR